ncbi:hypothetical protein D0817_03715 [Flavobacterium cupreum]|uniref:Fungal lipase-like domain-containing protein n=1 Tax=Flavobacterium cupreum TaxID=2133766 RepID=A0A434ABN1_9FLAO|nr:hypothetical protein [Flavobacterium cupreum]RUT71803.1 hypothetical protein D0817_03715 [Flavobacterium cupreum]
MKSLKKIKFSDIIGMLEIDEMREIIGGCGSGTGSDANYGFGGGGGAPALSGGGTGFGTSFSGSNYGGFGGSNAVGGGMYGSGSITGAGGSSFPGSPYYNGSAGSGTNNLNSSTLSNGYGGGWYTSYNYGKTTKDSVTIDRFFQFLDSQKGVVTNNQVFNFLNNELTTTGQRQNTQQYNIIQLPGTVLNNVTVQNNYKGPSKVPKGMVINNMSLFVDNSGNGISGGAASTVATSTGTNNASWYIMPLHGSLYKPTVLEAAVMSKAVYGDKVSAHDLGHWTISKPVAGVLYNDPKSGFKSQLYEKVGLNGKMEYCYVTAGTEPGDIGDYAADALQTAGISLQYQQSVNNAKILKAQFGDALSFAGHSLGGGMAEANARITGESATTFNAAGLSYATAIILGTGFVSDTHSYIMKNDPLNIAQMVTPGLTTAGGQKHFVSQNGTSSGGHSIDAMIAALRIVPN